VSATRITVSTPSGPSQTNEHSHSLALSTVYEPLYLKTETDWIFQMSCFKKNNTMDKSKIMVIRMIHPHTSTFLTVDCIYSILPIASSPFITLQVLVCVMSKFYTDDRRK
jgi:hypothetical protein